MSSWDARLQLHWAAQAAAGVGRSLLSPQPDFSHESFVWSDERGAMLQGLVTNTSRPFRAGIRLQDLTLLVVDAHGAIESELPMNGRTLAEGFAFFEQRAESSTLKHPPEGMPDHPVAQGATFDADLGALAELSRHYAEAASTLDEVRRAEAGAGPLRCWPHHFDIATLITIRGNGEDAHTVGVGMAPGDDSYREPYYYVTPWPYPRDATPPAFPHGAWHTNGWFGAVLLVRDDAPRENFLRTAVHYCRTMV